jgi:hypothetical protein
MVLDDTPRGVYVFFFFFPKFSKKDSLIFSHADFGMDGIDMAVESAFRKFCGLYGRGTRPHR